MFLTLHYIYTLFYTAILRNDLYGMQVYVNGYVVYRREFHKMRDSNLNKHKRKIRKV